MPLGDARRMPRHVRRQDHVLETPERMIGRQRLDTRKRPAPPRRISPARSAAVRSSKSTIAPRPMLMSTALGSCARTAVGERAPRSAACAERRSRRNRFAPADRFKRSGGHTSATPGGAAGRSGSTAVTFMPKQTPRRAISAPIEPSPTTPSAVSASVV